jgi:diadenosine tetraphosphate (Ap4A) HIT family hydrolase
MSPCIFCQIFTGELDSSRVLENDVVVAFLDIAPMNPGHTLVVPRQHVQAFTDLTPVEPARLTSAGQQVALALKAVFPDYEGFTFSIAEGEVAGQEVPHTHLHVIPRYKGDGFGWRRYGQREERARLGAIAAKIAGIINSVAG